ncbi:Plasmodium exported protein, unknown function [Plasmodium ovale wallikeri]|uniref:Plasmodium RESA N-terminal domain-containing protein n=1 Tax=Plasmodium ovale wallikeri TaxID=864142 RepID=A0A1A9ALG6_PLAOA|nr:Plasmodium exported protein, unknown function [Plasmodium ovale wallikeri]SBT57478.1 Plasmodium exported protein, unknown function [Plasmodium ovale wallikeri]
MVNPIKHFDNKNYICGRKIDQGCESIFKLENSAIFGIGRNLCQVENDETDNSTSAVDFRQIDGTSDVNEEQHVDQLRELTKRIMGAWTVTYTNMTKEYTALINEKNIDNNLSRKLWYNKWHRNIFRLLKEIDEIIFDNSYSMYEKEYHSYLLLNEANHSFRFFLDEVNREAEGRNESWYDNE